MHRDEPITSPSPRPAQVIPVALYESDGVIFELYRGAQPYQPRAIRWEHLKTLAVTRDGDLTFHVRISQAHCETPSG